MKEFEILSKRLNLKVWEQKPFIAALKYKQWQLGFTGKKYITSVWLKVSDIYIYIFGYICQFVLLYNMVVLIAF